MKILFYILGITATFGFLAFHPPLVAIAGFLAGVVAMFCFGCAAFLEAEEESKK